MCNITKREIYFQLCLQRSQPEGERWYLRLLHFIEDFAPKYNSHEILIWENAVISDRKTPNNYRDSAQEIFDIEKEKSLEHEQKGEFGKVMTSIYGKYKGPNFFFKTDRVEAQNVHL